MAQSEFPNKPGVYTLILEITKPTKEKIGGLNNQIFIRGFYAYTGSALGRSINLNARLSRHLAFKKNRHWHIDYLLSTRNISLRAIIYVITSIKAECQIVKVLENLPGIIVSIKGFGSSDCCSGCKSHLCYFPSISLDGTISKVGKVYKNVLGSFQVFMKPNK